MKKQGEILKRLIKEDERTATEIAALVGISRDTLYKLFLVDKLDEFYTFKFKSIGIDVLNKDNLTSVINKPDANQVPHRQTTKTKSNKEGLNASTATAVPYRIMKVPLVRQYAYAGYLSSYADEEYVQQLEKIEFMVDKEYRGNYLSFEVRGDSMDDGSYNAYKEGNIVCCREVNPDLWKSKLHIKDWEFIIVHDESIVLKQIISHDPEKGLITVHSFNPMYKDYEIDLREVKKIFNVVQTLKKR